MMSNVLKTYDCLVIFDTPLAFFLLFILFVGISSIVFLCSILISLYIFGLGDFFCDTMSGVHLFYLLL